MARQRDYKAEYARRKARFAANPALKKRYYQKQYEGDVRRAIREGYGSTRAHKTARRQVKDTNRWKAAQAFSDRFALTEKAMFLPSRAPQLGLTPDQYLTAYETAWYDYDDNRRTGTDGLYYWLVELDQFPDFNERDYYGSY